MACAVYTRVAPRHVPAPIITNNSSGPAPVSLAESLITGQVHTPTSEKAPDLDTPSAIDSPNPQTAQSPPPASISVSLHSKPETETPSVTSASSSLNRLNSTSQSHDSQVLHDTLNVINEHITDLRMPSNGAPGLRGHANDSGSEYSIPLEQRMSYIQGEETDEEEDGTRSRAEVEAWTADDVAENLFAAGVEQQHCEVFRDQDITGEVLLGMDQSSLFIKAFDLGSVGRRLKTWHKIKALQDEVEQHDDRRTTQTYSEIGSEKHRSRHNTLTNRPGSTQNRQVSGPATKSPATRESQEYRPGHVKRPSAASVRDLHHSRRYSATEFRPAPPTPGSASSATPQSPGADGHMKQPSFDRGWTLGTAFSPPGSQSPQLNRPLSSAGLQEFASSEQDLQDSAVDLDRGYFSGTDADGRKRNVLRKRDSGPGQVASYTDEQRVRSATALSRHSRFGSVDSYRDGPSTAAQKYYGIQSSSHRRNASTNTTESVRPLPPLKDNVPPTVTRLDTGSGRSPMAGSSKSFHSDWLSSVANRVSHKDLRSPGNRISDRTGTRTQIKSGEPSPKPYLSGSPAPSSSSAGPSFEFGSNDGTQSPSTSTAPSKTSRRKGKKDTSAYQRGLLKITPQEAKQDADYYGWMKKKSSHLMTTWKPRFFVLKGRRLSYYYSETDTEEKGLIDISFHRVLPADNEKLTGLHATITSAVGGPSIPNSSLSPTNDDGSKDSVFIFKLMPPRAGLSRAVTFTKPMVHYFAVPNVTQGRLWMAALMKATIDRDDTQPITTTYQQKTISLSKAKQMRHRPPALMGLDEAIAEHPQAAAAADATVGNPKTNSLGIFGDGQNGASALDKAAAVHGEAALISSPGGGPSQFGV